MKDGAEISRDGIVVDGRLLKTLELAGDRPAAWWGRQQLSVDYYKDTHSQLRIDDFEKPI